MKQKDVTILNIDDYMREQKVKGIRTIRWSKRCWAILRLFTKGSVYMGIKHYQRK